MTTGKVYIFAALHVEGAAIARAFGVGLVEKGVTVLRQGQPRVELYVVGIGAKRMPALDDGVSKIILAGVAGGLDPELRAGDVVVDGTGEKIHTAAKVITTAKEKVLLFHHARAVAVDMESAVVRHRAIALNIPVVAIRGISDTAGESLPMQLMKWIGETGRPSKGAFAVGLLLHPWLIPRLVRLGKRTKLAMVGVCRGIAGELTADERR